MLQLPRLYLNGFPKSGLHLAELMVRSVFSPVDKKYNWYATNAWVTESRHLDIAPKLAVTEQGQYFKGHAGYNEYLKDLLIGLEIGVVFVYRDLRDVAVSQTYHILSDKEQLLHPAKEIYPKNFDDALTAVIEGLGEYAGIIERWNTFAPWLDKYWVYCVKFEDMIKKPEKVASGFYDYFYQMALLHANIETLTIDKRAKNKSCAHIVASMKERKSLTFRKGKTGQWKYEFKPKHVELFKKHDTQNVLMKLGYEKHKDWH